MAQVSSSSSGSYTASSGEEEEEITAPAPITTTTTPKPRKPDSSSSDEEEDDISESASEDDKPPPPPSPPPPPPPSPPTQIQPLPPAAPSLKEPEGEQENGDGKKRQLFQRIWSEEDEIAVLRGLISYRAKNGHLPSSSGIESFQQTIEKDIHIQATKNQLVKKIRSLKDKFIKNSTRAKSGLCFDLSKEIWAGDLGTGKRKKPPSDCEALPSASKKLKHAEEIAAADETPPTYPFLREAMFKMGSAYVGGLAVARKEMELIGDAEAAVLEKQFENLRVLELSHRVEEIAILNEMVKLILDG